MSSWLVTTSTTVALALGGWGLLGVADNRERIARVETEIRRLERIEDKLDWLIGEKVKDYRRDTPPPAEQPRRFPEAPRRAPEPPPAIPPQGAVNIQTK